MRFYSQTVNDWLHSDLIRPAKKTPHSLYTAVTQEKETVDIFSATWLFGEGDHPQGSNSAFPHDSLQTDGEFTITIRQLFLDWTENFLQNNIFHTPEASLEVTVRRVFINVSQPMTVRSRQQSTDALIQSAEMHTTLSKTISSHLRQQSTKHLFILMIVTANRLSSFPLAHLVSDFFCQTATLDLLHLWFHIVSGFCFCFLTAVLLSRIQIVSFTVFGLRQEMGWGWKR